MGDQHLFLVTFSPETLNKFEILAALAAVVAASAGDERVDRDALAGARTVDDRAAELVSENQRRVAARIAAVIRVHVGAANADRIDVEHDLVGSPRRIGLIAVRDLVRIRVDQRFQSPNR